MKKAFLTFGLLVSQLTFAQITRSDALKDRVELTEAAIRTSIEDFRNVKEGADQEYADFEAQITKFNQAVEKELIQYQQGFIVELIEPTKKKISDYKKVKTAPGYSDEERTILLREMFARMSEDVDQRSTKFQTKWMRRLIALMGLDSAFYVTKIEDYSADYALTGFASFSDLIKLYRLGDNWTDRISKGDFMKKLFESYPAYARNLYKFTPQVHQPFAQCFSRGCQTLLLHTYNKYLQLLMKLNASFSYVVDENMSLQFKSSEINLSALETLIQKAFRTLKETKPFFLYKNEFDSIRAIHQAVISSSDLQTCTSEVIKLKKQLCADQPDACIVNPGEITTIETNLSLTMEFAPFAQDSAAILKLDASIAGVLKKLQPLEEEYARGAEYRRRVKLESLISNLEGELKKFQNGKTQLQDKRHGCLLAKPTP